MAAIPPGADPSQPRVFAINAAVDRLGAPLYLIWINGIMFLAGGGGFVLFHSLAQDPGHDDVWLFAGAFAAGLMALAVLVRHLVTLRRRVPDRLILDENTVTLRYGDQNFNLGLLEFILWDRDYRKIGTGERDGRIRTRLLISYRRGTHFEQGGRQTDIFDADTTRRQMAALQDAYFRVMLLNKSRRKIQRQNAGRVRQLEAQNDIQGLAKLLQQLSGASVIEAADIAQSNDPRDRIQAFYGGAQDDATARLVKRVAGVAGSRPLAVLSDVLLTIVGGVMMLFNLAVLWAILSA